MTLNALPAWATNANYSTGPNVGTPTKIDPSSAPNGFIEGVIAAPQHVNFLLNALAGEVPKALDGQDGGTYALQSDLEIDGPAALVISGRQEIASGAALDLEDGAVLNVKAHANLDVESLGDINVKSGGDINVNSGGAIDVEAGAVVNVASGGSIIAAAGAVINVGAAAVLAIDNAYGDFRLALQPVMIADSGGPVWKGEIGGTWLMHATGVGTGYIVFALPLRVGDLLTTLRMTLQGGAFAGHAGTPADAPLFQLIETDLNGVTTIIKSTSDPVTHPSYDSVHSVTMSGGALPYTATANPLYVRVVVEGGANSVVDTTRLCSIDGTLVARSFRTASEIY